MPHLPDSKRKRYRPAKKMHAKNKGSVYNNRRWRRLSELYRRENPLCEIALANNEIMPSEDTDHIVRLSIGGSMCDPRNLMALSKHYHRIKTGKEAHSFQIDTVETMNGLIPLDRQQAIRLVLGNDELRREGGGNL